MSNENLNGSEKASLNEFLDGAPIVVEEQKQDPTIHVLDHVVRDYLHELGAHLRETAQKMRNARDAVLELEVRRHGLKGEWALSNDECTLHQIDPRTKK